MANRNGHHAGAKEQGSRPALAANGQRAAAPLIENALARLASGLYVLSAAFEGARLGVCVQWVQRCSREPACLSVALLKGHPISPVIRDSRAFALCAIDPADRLLVRSFEHGAMRTGEEGENGVAQGSTAASLRAGREDAFLAFETETLATGSPILKRAALALDCRVMMHLDFEGDHELYLAEVVAARSCEPPPSKKPAK